MNNEKNEQTIEQQKKYEELMNLDPNNISNVPEEFLTEEMCKKAIEKDPDNIKYVPWEMVTNEMCKEALNKDASTFKYIYEDAYIREPEIIELAFKLDPDNVEFLSNEEMTCEMWLYAIREDFDLIWFLAEEYRNNSGQVKLQNQEFEFIFDQILTVEKCKEIVEECPEDILKLPHYCRTSEMYEIAIESAPWLVESIYIETANFTPKLAELYVEGLIENKVDDFLERIEEIPYESRTPQIWVTLLKIDFDSYVNLIPTSFYNNEDIIAIVKYKLKQLVQNNKTIDGFSILCNYVISLFPELKKALNEDTIKTLNEDKLLKIIDSLGERKDTELSLEQKIKFAYLTNKHLDFSVVEWNKNCNEFTAEGENISKFFADHFNFGLVNDNYINKEEMEKIKLNMDVFKDYDSSKFFNAVEGNGVKKIGNEQKEFTKEDEKLVITELMMQEIPLNDIIVRTAFEYYNNGKLEEFITLLQSYDMIFNKDKTK